VNVFVLSTDPRQAAEMHCDQHVVKMVVESAQMLCTAHRVLDGRPVLLNSPKGRKIKAYVLPDWRQDRLYKATHVGHPSTVWTSESRQNYEWHYELFTALCDQYTLRYGRRHLSDTKLRHVLRQSPFNIESRGLTEFRLAISRPECVVPGDAVQSYRLFYRTKQERFELTWTKVRKPHWF